MSLFEHILVPVDFTDKNQRALEMALALARQNEARVTLLHVIEQIEYADDAEIQELYRTLQARATEQLAAMGQPFADAGIEAAQRVEFGRRGATIVRAAATLGVDLVVLSSHRIDPSHPTEGWGTLSHQVSMACQCPALLVR